MKIERPEKINRVISLERGDTLREENPWVQSPPKHTRTTSMDTQNSPGEEQGWVPTHGRHRREIEEDGKTYLRKRVNPEHKKEFIYVFYD